MIIWLYCMFVSCIGDDNKHESLIAIAFLTVDLVSQDHKIGVLCRFYRIV